MKKIALVTGLVSSAAVPPKDESSIFYVDLMQNYAGGQVAMISIGGQILNLAPTTLNENIGVAGLMCKTSKKCNTPNSFDRTTSESVEVVNLNDDQQIYFRYDH